MKIKALILTIAIVSSSAFAGGKITYLACPQLDDRAKDLIVVLNQDNGTASVQSPSNGSGLNFTSQASFGPDRVEWRKDSKSLKQLYSVNRETLILERKTFSEMSGVNHTDKSDCSIVKKSKSAKF